MQLSLFGWPPFASHLTCLIVGFIASNLSGPSQQEEIGLGKAAVVFIAESRDFIGGKFPDPMTPLDGIEVSASGSDDNSKCRYSLQNIKFRRSHLGEAMVATDRSHLEMLCARWIHGKHGLKFAPSASLSHLPSCQSRPDIRYEE